MREYPRSESRWGEEDLDEYGYDRYDGYAEEEGGAGDEYYDDDDVGEEEEEEEEPQQPTQEEMEFLSTREKLKEKIRQKLRKETSAALGKTGPLVEKKPQSAANSEFGSFFGPSRPAVSRRVIEERHAILETQHIRSKEPSSTPDVKRVVSSSGHEGKNNVTHERPKVSKEVKSKAQALKDIRDYSFLFEDDADLPDPAKDKAPKKPSVHSDIRSAEAPRPKVPAPKPSVSGASVRDKKVGGPSGHGMQARMQTSMNGLMPSSSSRSLPGGNVGNGSSRPLIQKATSSGHQQSNTVKKPVALANDKPALMERKPSALKPDLSQKRVPDTRESREPPKSKVMGQQASSSRPPLPSARPPLPSARPPLPSSKPPLPSSRPQQSSSRPQQSSARPQQSSARPQQLTSSSRPQQITSSSRPQQLTSSSRPQQLTSSSRTQQPPSLKTQQSSSQSRPQERVPSRPQAQTASRLQQASSSKPQQQMASRPHQPISSRPAQNTLSSKFQPSSSSRPQMSKPIKSMTQQRPQESRLKKRPARYSDEDDEDEDAKALSMLRRLTGYNPRRFADDDDDSDMEATFDDIMDEEYISERIGAKEDEEQLRLIQQEEEEERRRMMRKKRKLR